MKLTQEEREALELLVEKEAEARKAAEEVNRLMAEATPEMRKALSYVHFQDKEQTTWNYDYGSPYFPVGLNTVGMDYHMTDIDSFHFDWKSGRAILIESKYIAMNAKQILNDAQCKAHLEWLKNSCTNWTYIVTRKLNAVHDKGKPKINRLCEQEVMFAIDDRGEEIRKLRIEPINNAIRLVLDGQV